MVAYQNFEDGLVGKALAQVYGRQAELNALFLGQHFSLERTVVVQTLVFDRDCLENEQRWPLQGKSWIVFVVSDEFSFQAKILEKLYLLL